MNELSENYVFNMFAKPKASLTAIKAFNNRIVTKEYGELLDFESGCWAAVLGHSRKEIIEAIIENSGLLFHTHQFFDTEHPGALVKELIDAAELKCNYKGTFMSSGSEAVSLAVMLCSLLTERKKSLSFTMSYLGACSDLRMPRNPEEWIDLDVTECLSCTKCCNCRDCGKFKNIDFSTLSAFVFEPGNSGGLVLCPPEKLITFICEEIRHGGGFVIANEVTTGFGRTGKWFGFQHYDSLNSKATSPDFIAMGKGLGNGYPISGLLVRPKLAHMVETTGFRYVQSHMNDPLGCIVSRKVVEVMSKESLVEQGNKIGEYLRESLMEIGIQTGEIKEIRGRGMMNLVVLENSYKANEVFLLLLKKGIFVGYSEVYNVLRFYAPLTTSREDVDILCTSLKEILQSYLSI